MILEIIIEVIEGAEDYYDARAKVMETFGFDRIQAQKCNRDES